MTFRFVKNNIFAKPLRNLLVVISCTVSIILMLMMVTIFKQVDKQYSASNSQYNIVLGAKGSKTELVLDAMFYNGIPENVISYEVYEDILADMSSETPHFSSAMPLAMGDNISGFSLVGVIPAFLHNYEIAQGIPLGEFDQARPTLVLGATAAEAMGATLDSEYTASHNHALSEDYQEDAHHSSYKYYVGGILKKTGSSIDNAIFCNLEAVWAVHSHEEEGEDHDHEGEHEEEHHNGLSAIVALCIGSNYQYALNDFAAENTDIMVVSIGETLTGVMDLFGSAGGIVLAVVVVVIIMSFNMLFLAMFTSASERKRDVAILRAIGSSRYRILLTIMLESLVLILVSCILGLLLSFAGLALVGGVFSGLMGISISPVYMCIEQLYIILGAVGVALLATLIPALMVYKTEPSKYLR